MKKLLASLALATLGTGASAQNYQWANDFAGTGTTDVVKSVVLDASGNVYTLGHFSAVIDFDPGPGTYTLAANGVNTDFFITKQDASGNLIWARNMGGSNNELACAMTIDASGNIYVAGSTSSIGGDFDPGTGTYTLSTTGADDVVICKLDASGNFVWARNMGGTGSEIPYAIKVDVSGNIYTIGTLSSVADMDPGAGTYTITTTGGNDIFISKLDASGNFISAKNLGGTGHEAPRSITTDAAGNVYMLGMFAGVTDFDLGPGTFNLTAAGSTDIFITKMDASGNFGWVKQITGPSNENGFSVQLDPSNNIYISGSHVGTVDFDPSPATYTMTPTAGSDIFVAKLDNAGNFLWAKGMAGAGTSDHAYSSSVDAFGNVYITGIFSGITDFDPGVGTYTVNTNGGGDVFICKLDASGSFGWVKTVGSTSSDMGNSIATDAAGNIYVGGAYSSSMDADPGPGVNTLALQGGSDAFITKYTSCNMPASSSVITSSSSSLCPGATMAFSTATVTGASSYSWTMPSGASITSGQNTNSITVTFGSSSGTIVVTPSNTCGSSASASLAITVNALPVIGVTASPASAVVCSGSQVSLSGTGATTYTWTNGISNGVLFNPAASATYTVTGTDANGCVNTATAVVTVNSLPNLTVSVSPSSTVCTGASVTLSGMGASTYTWSNGITNGTAFTPTGSATYTVSGTDANGCVNTTSSSVVISNTLTINATVSGSVVCNGSPVTLSGTGANTYTWTNGVTNGVAFTPTATASYTLTGTDANGCQATTVKTITVNALPALGATTNRSLICAGQTATITALGASTYTWSTNQTSASIAVSPAVNTSYTVSGTGANGCIGTVAFTQSVSACTGIEELSNHGLEVKTYPNPNAGSFTIAANADASLVLFNSLGEFVRAIELKDANDHRVLIEGLSSGLYVLVGQTDKKTFGQKIIVTQ